MKGTIVAAVLALGCSSGVRSYSAQSSTPAPRLDAYERAALARSAEDIGCDDDEARVDSLGNDSYRVWGCGQYALYHCVRNGRRPMCVMNARGELPEQAQADVMVETMLRDVNDDVVSCLTENTSELVVDLGISPRGQVRRIGQPHADAAVLACVDERLARVHVARPSENARFLTARFARPEEAAP